jgi:hypothetical protein
MFCSNCGQKTAEEARFCSRCGNSLGAVEKAKPATSSAAVAQQQIFPVPLAINLNTSLLGTAPHIFWLDFSECGFIKVDPGIYAQVTRPAPHEKEKAQAFRDYAGSLRKQAFETLFTACPGSIKFGTTQIRSLRLHKYYDADFHKSMQYARFTMVTNAGKFRGSFERDTDTAFLETTFYSLLGSRFSSHEIVNSMDDD